MFDFLGQAEFNFFQKDQEDSRLHSGYNLTEEWKE